MSISVSIVSDDRLKRTLTLFTEKPKGVKQLPQADGWYKYFRPDKVNPNHVNGANPGVDFNL